MFLRILSSLFLLGSAISSATYTDLAKAAIERTKQGVRYDPSYAKISYPMGDVPSDIGVCTDVIIRSYRMLGIDLQELIHKDMKLHFNQYPKLWGLKRTDTNIDHRRVPNLRVFFKRHGTSLKVTSNGKDYKPGDIVTWNLRGKQGNLPHIGIVTTLKSQDEGRYLIAHNIGAGPELEDVLFKFDITGHYRYGLENS